MNDRYMECKDLSSQIRFCVEFTPNVILEAENDDLVIRLQEAEQTSIVLTEKHVVTSNENSNSQWFGKIASVSNINAVFGHSTNYTKCLIEQPCYRTIVDNINLYYLWNI